MSVIGRVLFVIILCATFYFQADFVKAGFLSYVSDTITNSAPSATTSSHSIRFTVENPVPVGGKIVVTTEAEGGSALNVPVALDHTDFDFSVSTSGPFTDRSLAAVSSATSDGVSIVSGSAGSFTITLGSGATSSIAAGNTVLIEIGSVATHESTGNQWIQNPSSAGTYRIRIETRDAVDTMIDRASTVIAIILPVTMGPVDTINPIPPVRSSGLPTGLLPGSTGSVWISLRTDIIATCRYATTPGVPYTSMSTSTIFTTANLGTLHYQQVSVATSTNYSFYVRCVNTSLAANPDDFSINFDVGVVPSAPPSPPKSGLHGGGGGGGLFLSTGDVKIHGKGVPMGTLIVTKDGAVEKESLITALGSFDLSFLSLQRGPYTWGVLYRDRDGRKSRVYNSTIYLIAGTTNVIGPVYLSPTISASSTMVAPGSDVLLSGYATPLLPVQVLMNKQGDAIGGKIVSATTTAGGEGAWSITLPTHGLPKGTYEIKAKTLVSRTSESNLSPAIYVGIGESPNVNFSDGSDLNGDGKVNLVDFAILLFHWRTSEASADINQDGTVNLSDLSIMLSNWTG